MCVCVCVCVCLQMHVCVLNMPLYIFGFAVYLFIYICMLGSEFSHVCVYLLKLLLINSCMVWWSYGLKPFYFVHCMGLYIFPHRFVGHIVP